MARDYALNFQFGYRHLHSFWPPWTTLPRPFFFFFSWVALACFLFSLLYVKEYFVGRYFCWSIMHHMEYNSEIVDKAFSCYVQKLFTCVQDPHESRMLVQCHKARPHSRSGCPAGTSTPYVCCPNGKLKLLSQISTCKKFQENLIWKHFVAHLEDYLL